VLQDGTREREVLAVSGWEDADPWNEIAGALALKGFSMGPGVRAVRLHGMGWGLPDDKAAALERCQQGALTRLADLLSTQSSHVSAQRQER
jgi:hypothetical protein